MTYQFLDARILAVNSATSNRNLLSHAISSETLFAMQLRGKSALLLAHLLRVRRFCVGIAIQIAVKPVELPVQALDEMLRLARSREIVVLARKEDQLRGHAIVLQRAEPLFALLDGHAEVVVGMKNKRWRAYIARIF